MLWDVVAPVSDISLGKLWPALTRKVHSFAVVDWAPTLHARGCLARGVFFAGHPAQLHNGFEGCLWERQFTMTQTGPVDMSDRVCCGVYSYLLPGGGVCTVGFHSFPLTFIYLLLLYFCYTAPLHYLYSRGVDCWTRSWWLYSTYVCTAPVFFVVWNTAGFWCIVSRQFLIHNGHVHATAALTMLLSACHMADLYVPIA